MKSLEVLAFQRWHQSYIEKNEPGALNKILKEFYATVCKKDREDYKPEPLCSVLTAIDCTEQSKSTNAPLHYL